MHISLFKEECKFCVSKSWWCHLNLANFYCVNIFKMTQLKFLWMICVAHCYVSTYQMLQQWLLYSCHAAPPYRQTEQIEKSLWSLWNIYIVSSRMWYYAKGHLYRMQMGKVIVVLAVVWCHLYISNECFLLNKIGLAHLKYFFNLLLF